MELSRRVRIIVCAATMLVACAGPGKVMLDDPGSVPVEFELVDARAVRALSARTEGTSEYLGENQFAISPLVALKHGLQRAAGPALKGRKVVVTEFDSFVHTRWKGPGGPGPHNLATSVVANVLSAGLIYGVESARADRFACTHILIDVGGNSYMADDCEPAGMTGQESVLRRVILATIAKLGANIAERPPRSS